ncbi:MAG: hypothetical protein V1807_00215 [Patescibacteria group bacterium]
MTIDNDELDSLESTIDDLEKDVPALLDLCQSAPSVYEEQITELRQQVATLTRDNQELQDLLKVAEEECTGLKLKIGETEEQIRELQRHKKNSKADIESLRKENKRLKQDAERLICILDDVVDGLQREETAEVADEASSCDHQLVTGVLVGCGDDFWARYNMRQLGKFSKGCPTISFLDDPILMLSGSKCPPIPKVNVVVLITSGLTHTDSDSVRTMGKSMGAHFIDGYRASFMIKVLNEWIKNPTFASASA